jgi:hypothetical protein
MDEIVSNTQTSYDQVATEYVKKFKDAMGDKHNGSSRVVTQRAYLFARRGSTPNA